MFACTRVLTSVPVPLPTRACLRSRAHARVRVGCAINKYNSFSSGYQSLLVKTSPSGGNQVDGLPPVSNTETRISVAPVASKFKPFRPSTYHNSSFDLRILVASLRLAKYKYLVVIFRYSRRLGTIVWCPKLWVQANMRSQNCHLKWRWLDLFFVEKPNSHGFLHNKWCLAISRTV
jgi:hypothetical protein